MPTMKLRLTTDGNGYLHKTERYNPPGPFSLTISLAARLLRPAETRITGDLDIDSADGSPSNNRRGFVIRTGERIALGEWRLDGGDNVIVVRGRTHPARPDTELELELDASL